MGGWQITYIVLMCLSLGISLKEHGEPKTGYNNFWTSLLAVGIQIGILYMGGFFS